MPAKLKPSELVTCEICGGSFSGKEVVTHNSSCTEACPLSICPTGRNEHLHQVTHSIIYGRILYGKLQTIKLKDIQDHVHQTAKSNSVILLNPATMRHCKISFAMPVILNKSAVFHAWPSSQVSINCVGMEKESLKLFPSLMSKEYFMVQELAHPCIEAKTFWFSIKSIDSIINNEQFTNFIVNVCVGRYIKVGCPVYIDYYGKECKLQIRRITGTDETEVTGDSLELDDSRNITEDMKHMCNISDPPSMTSTPVRVRPQKEDSSSDSDSGNIFYLVSHNTKAKLITDNTNSSDNVNAGPNLSDFGGYVKEVEKIRELISNHLFRASALHSQGFSTPQGALLYGPSGSGKTMLAKAICKSFPIEFITITGSDVWSKFYGETESRLQKLFQQAKECSPSVIFLDDVNVLCPRRETSRNEVEKRVTATFLTLLDGVNSGCTRVFVLATTNKRNDLDVAVRRPGRLDTEIEIGVPSAEDRGQILEKILRKCDHTIPPEGITDIAERAHGFLGSDLAALSKEATLQALKKGQFTDGHRSCPSLTIEHLLYGLQVVKPSAMREVTLEVSKVSWDDIGGQEDLKHKLRQAVEWPLKHPAAFTRLGIRPPRGLLMYGPPGCSKTMIAKALAKESGLNFIAIKGPELFSKWVGESERAVREVFGRARAAAPAIVFFDEIDALASARGSGSGGGGDVSDRVLAQLLTEMDGVEALEDILVVAATNRPDRIDKALMRPGRLDRIVYVPLPDAITREAIFKIQFKKTPVSEDICMEDLVRMTESYSGAEVAAVCHEAALSAMQEDIDADCVHWRHLQEALTTVTPRITPELMVIYDKYQKQSSSVK